MATNTLKTRIQSKYDTLQNWINSASATPPFKPLKGEICIVEIPNSATPADTQTTGQSHMSPPAIAVKVGDGVHTFIELPWIQAIAGDVYGWAKSSTKPTYNGTEIQATRKPSAGSTDQASWTTPTVESWLQSLTDDINSITSGGGSISTQIAAALAELDVDNDSTSSATHHITGFDPSKTLATLIEENGYIAATFQDIQIAESQVTSLTTHLEAKAPTANPTFTGTVTLPTISSSSPDTAAATKKYVDDRVAGLTGAMHFIGISTTIITDGGTQNPTINSTEITTKNSGDVVLYNNGTSIAQEYVWTGSAWELLGDEGSYAVKGSITNADISDNAAIAQSKISSTSGWITSGLNSKQDTLVFNTAYSSSDNKVATMSDVSSAVSGLLSITSAAATYVAKNGTDRLITSAEGDKLANIASGAEVNVLEGIKVPNSSATDTTLKELTITSKTVTLAKIAETGDANHLLQGANDYLIFDCGTSSSII